MYRVKVWQEGNWWLARVAEASDDADTAPLNALTQARTQTEIKSMAHDLITTILDANEDTFDLDVQHV